MAAKTVGGNEYRYFESYRSRASIYFILCFVFNKLFKMVEKKMEGSPDYALAIEYMDNQ
jgi:putative lysine transport system permease protein